MPSREISPMKLVFDRKDVLLTNHTVGDYTGISDTPVFDLPLSKSMAARVMTCCWLADRFSFDKHLPRKLPDCEDTEYLKNAFHEVSVNDGIADVELGDGGTTLRFFMTAIASAPGTEVRMSYSGQLAARPVKPLLDTLYYLGADIKIDDSRNGIIEVKGKELSGGEVSVDSSISSQFISALMMAAPLWKKGLRLTAKGTKVSWPYVGMTAGVMRDMGVPVKIEDDTIVIPRGGYAFDKTPVIETDWSAAMLAYELAMVLPEITVGLLFLIPPGESVQGDSGAVSLFGKLGVRTRWNADGSASVTGDSVMLEQSRLKSEISPFIFDMGDYPDVVPYLVVGMCMAGIRFRVENIGHLRHKESDRIKGLAENLERLGFIMATGSDFISWDGGKVDKDRGITTISTYSDHRMAMAFAPAAVSGPLIIDNPSSVNKSFPDVWSQLAKFGFRSE